MIIDDDKAFRDYLDMMIDLHPELFPQDIQTGYHLHGLSPISKKMPDVRTRRIKLKLVDATGREQVYTVAPSFVLPYGLAILMPSKTPCSFMVWAFLTGH